MTSHFRALDWRVCVIHCLMCCSFWRDNQVLPYRVSSELIISNLLIGNQDNKVTTPRLTSCTYSLLLGEHELHMRQSSYLHPAEESNAGLWCQHSNPFTPVSYTTFPLIVHLTSPLSLQTQSPSTLDSSEPFISFQCVRTLCLCVLARLCVGVIFSPGYY